MLAPVPEPAKWEMDDDASQGGTANSDAKLEKYQVPLDWLKCAENAIFAKAISAIRPSDIKTTSGSGDRAVVYAGGNKQGEQVQPRNHEPELKEAAGKERESEKKESKAPLPVRLSVKQRLGHKVDDLGRIVVESAHKEAILAGPRGPELKKSLGNKNASVIEAAQRHRGDGTANRRRDKDGERWKRGHCDRSNHAPRYSLERVRRVDERRISQHQRGALKEPHKRERPRSTGIDTRQRKRTSSKTKSHHSRDHKDRRDDRHKKRKMPKKDKEKVDKKVRDAGRERARERNREYRDMDRDRQRKLTHDRCSDKDKDHGRRQQVLLPPSHKVKVGSRLSEACIYDKRAASTSARPPAVATLERRSLVGVRRRNADADQTPGGSGAAKKRRTTSTASEERMRKKHTTPNKKKKKRRHSSSSSSSDSSSSNDDKEKGSSSKKSKKSKKKKKKKKRSKHTS